MPLMRRTRQEPDRGGEPDAEGAIVAEEHPREVGAAESCEGLCTFAAARARGDNLATGEEHRDAEHAICDRAVEGRSEEGAVLRERPAHSGIDAGERPPIAGADAGRFERFIELGPGTALSGFMKRIDKNAQMLSVADPASLDATVKALQS